MAGVGNLAALDLAKHGSPLFNERWFKGGLKESLSMDSLIDIANDARGASIGKKYSKEKFDDAVKEIENNASRRCRGQ